METRDLTIVSRPIEPAFPRKSKGWWRQKSACFLALIICIASTHSLLNYNTSTVTHLQPQSRFHTHTKGILAHLNNTSGRLNCVNKIFARQASSTSRWNNLTKGGYLLYAKQ